MRRRNSSTRRKSRKAATAALRAPQVAQGEAPAFPYVVRFGPWARNLYLGLPAAGAFLLVSLVAEMPLWFLCVWDGVVALLAYICAFPREVRIYSDRVVVMRRLFALVPVWWRTRALSDFKALICQHGSHRFVGEAEVAADTVYLVLKSGRVVPVQSYSSGAADNQPPRTQLLRDLTRLTGLPETG